MNVYENNTYVALNLAKAVGAIMVENKLKNNTHFSTPF